MHYIENAGISRPGLCDRDATEQNTLYVTHFFTLWNFKRAGFRGTQKMAEAYPFKFPADTDLAVTLFLKLHVCPFRDLRVTQCLQCARPEIGKPYVKNQIDTFWVSQPLPSLWLLPSSDTVA